MILIQQVIYYLFPTLLAFAILSFFYGIALMKWWKDYEKINEGKSVALIGLASMFLILLIWGVIHSVLALIA